MNHRKLSDAYLDNTNYGDIKIRENFGACRPKNGNPFGPAGGFGTPDNKNYGLNSTNKWWICETNNGVRTGRVKVNPAIEVAETCTAMTPYNYEGCGYVPPRDSVVVKQLTNCYVTDQDVSGKTYPIVIRKQNYIETQTSAGGGKTFEQAKVDAGPLTDLYCTKTNNPNFPNYSCWADKSGNGQGCFQFPKNSVQPYSIEQATAERTAELNAAALAAKQKADSDKILADGAAFTAGLSKANLVNIDTNAIMNLGAKSPAGCTVM